jgi:NitT/TauT family transport system permease protein
VLPAVEQLSPLPAAPLLLLFSCCFNIYHSAAGIQPMTRYRSYLLTLLSACIVFGSWEIAGRVPVSFAFPTFTETIAAFWVLLVDGTMFVAYVETLKPLVVGVLISAFVGIALGLAIGLSSVSDWLLSPIFVVMQTAPLAALIPLLVMIYGIGLTSKVAVVLIMAMPVIVLNTSGAVRNTPVSIIEMAQAFLGTKRDVIFKVILPAASPIIFAGLLAELKITPTGVGDIITYSRSIADYPSMYAAIMSIILLAVIFLNVLERIEAFLFKGKKQVYASDL